MAVKAEILKALREQEDYLSGQEISKRFGVTRAAVWKAVQSLQKDGYCIEAVQNRGYKLISGAVYGEAEIKSRIQTKWAGKELQYYASLISTNLAAKQAGEEGREHGFLVVADEQTQGRGRRGRTWQSPKGSNIYFTILLRPQIVPAKASMLTLVMAHSVAGAVREMTGAKVQIKWPNDILVKGRKICGILTEMSLEQEDMQYLVCGVGINVQHQEFPVEMADKAGTLEDLTGKSISKAELLALVMKHFERDYECFMASQSLKGLKDGYEAMLVNKDREVRVLDPKGEWSGIARGILETGELVVEDGEKNRIPVYAGEVSVRGVQGYV